MKKIQTLSTFFTLAFSLFLFTSFAQNPPPDTVKTGVYITSIHDIDFKQKEYTIDLWLWLKYNNPKFDFLQNLEIPQAKTVTKSYSTIDTLRRKNLYTDEAAMHYERFVERSKTFPLISKD
jgi:hypothetical protein